ncbi:MAG: HAD-IA family hydrolase [Erythrobacter sp.]
MAKSTILFGSIGTIVETSDIQRRAYNAALKEAGLRWQWDRDTYSQLLEMAGGKERLAMLAAATGTSLSQAQIEAIHRDKTDRAGAMMRENGAALRDGVAEVIAMAKEHDMKLGLVTTTYAANIDTVFDAVGDALSTEDFEVIITRGDVAEGKPHPECYEKTLAKLEIAPMNALAIEDTANSVMAAKRAGIFTIATPGELTADQDFWQADRISQNLAKDVRESVG